MYIFIIFIRSHLFCNVLLHRYTSVHISTHQHTNQTEKKTAASNIQLPNKAKQKQQCFLYTHICESIDCLLFIFFMIMRWGCGDDLNNKYEIHCTLPKIPKTHKNN